MLSPQVKQAIENSVPTEDISLLVAVQLKDDLVRLAQIPDVAVRKRMLNDLYQKAKAPLVQTIAKYEKGGMRIVNDLNGSAQLIVSGPAELWARMMHEPSLNASNIAFYANERSWSVPGRSVAERRV